MDALSNPYDPPAPQPPVIPESLRRKYRPPIKGAQSVIAPGKNGQAQQKKTTGSNNNAKEGLVNKAAAANDDDDDDELPEPLKRFGKELVQKIENEIMDGGDPITFDDIAGLHDAKRTIQEVICWPMKRPDLFTGLRKAPNGLLLYGPPGTGKTLIGKAIAHESGATFFSISSSSLTSKWIGEGEKLVRVMFAVAAVREPSVVFIDEIDSLLTQRKSDENEASRRIKTEFLVQLDGTGTTAQGRVLTIGATNRPQELDEAARRRFVKRLYIPLPVESDRGTLLRVLLNKNNHRVTSDEVDKLAKETEGFSGADLKALCADAAMGPIRRLGAKALEVEASDVPPISYKHFRQSLRSMKPSVAQGDLVQYEEWDKTYGSKRIEDEMDDDSSDGEWNSVFASDTV
jgi:SpoVK/Ycf46/Vps4 family AAA+-type ATPase